jgi:hypothetical protein
VQSRPRGAPQAGQVRPDPSCDERLASVGSHDHVTRLEVRRRVLEEAEVALNQVALEPAQRRFLVLRRSALGLEVDELERAFERWSSPA